MPEVQYYAITKYNTTRNNPFSVVRLKEGVFEEYENGAWVQTAQYDPILIGEFVDYESINQAEALEIIKKRKNRNVQ
ncbi:hypothetical protein EDC14_1004167 [Hydrogenispora ethanolica]|jgi:hypothetical protein|uniref:Uncharacterized protein n=1 Tax=Hydrogenispora ethanolica TaxID=1082276 RepID=A0A4R1S525_HYDET|nr:hypothetical protein [Hydrogenispora ethanolica]TCL74229.1 hypothetical protein EDC14_1004167 [Hydrogenispora ethanolica]